MKRLIAVLTAILLLVPPCVSEGLPEAGGSFGSSFQSAVSLPSVTVLPRISFTGYGYAFLSPRLFIGGFGEGFGGKETTSGFGGLALGLWLGPDPSVWYLLSFTGVGLLGHQGVPRLGMLQEATINRAVFLSNHLFFSVFAGLNAQASLSGGRVGEILSLSPVLRARMDFGRYDRSAK